MEEHKLANSSGMKLGIPQRLPVLAKSFGMASIFEPS